MKSLLLMLVSSAIVSGQTLQESQQNYSKTNAPSSLTWHNFDAVAKHASQSEQERRYLSVDWKNSVITAQQAAFKADKPIMMILFFGDHRINC